MSLYTEVKEKIKSIPKSELSYKLNNEDIPVLMQDLPGLGLLSKIALDCEPSLVKINDNRDIFLTILAIIFRSSLSDLTDIGMGRFFNAEEFFKRLENTFIFLLDYYSEAVKFKRNKQTKFKAFIELVNEFIDENYTEKQFFESIKGAHTDSRLLFQDFDRLNTYITILREYENEN